MKINANILRTYQVLHSWTGIISGLLLFIGFFAGAIILFQANITDWATPPAEQHKLQEKTDYDSLLQQVVTQYPDALKEVKVNLEPNKAAVTWQNTPTREISLTSETFHASLTEQQQLQVEISNANLLTTLIDQLHRTGGLAGEVGHDHWGTYVLGIASILYFLALVSGLIFLLPTLLKSLFALRDGKSTARFWLDSHNLLGIFSFPFHVVIALTVVVFVFHDFFYAGLNPIYGEQKMFSRPPPAKVAFDPVNLPPVSELIAKAEQEAKGYKVKNIALMNLNSKAPMAMIAVSSDTDVVRGPYYDYVYMHPYTHQSFDFGNAHGENGIWAKMVKTFFAVHFGSFGGDSGRWLYFFLGLAGAALFYTGNLLWLDKKYQKKAVQQPRSVNILAKLTVAVPVGSMLGVAAAFVITKPLLLAGVEINSSYLFCYYSVFVASLAISFAHGHIKAAITLLKALSVTLISIPLISLALHITGQWEVTQALFWLIDIAAFLFALLFFNMAKKAEFRAAFGKPQSLWKTPEPLTAS